MTTKEISISEVKKHKTKKSIWLVIHNDVYDVTPFLAEHPGGEDPLLDEGGKDATVAFEDVGHSEDARQMLKKYKIGSLPISEHSKPVATCCPAVKGKQSKTNKSWRTYDGGSSSSYPESSKKSPKEPHTPKAERRVQSIVVPKESSNNMKWLILALAGAIVIGLVMKKYMG